MSGETVRLIRVFVSSPGDVDEERRILTRVVEFINDNDGEERGFQLKLFRWEQDVASQIGPAPQDVVDLQTPQYDIYLGIMSTRFGSGGTGKEFHDALERWRDTGEPWISFYFNAEPKLTGDPEQATQFAEVCKFRSELEKMGIVATYKGIRGDDEAFYETALQQLTRVVREQDKKTRSQQAVEQRPAADFKQRFPAKPTIPSRYSKWLQNECADISLLGLPLKDGQVADARRITAARRRSSDP